MRLTVHRQRKRQKNGKPHRQPVTLHRSVEVDRLGRKLPNKPLQRGANKEGVGFRPDSFFNFRERVGKERVIIYRASELGSCTKFLVAKRLGYDEMEPPDDAAGWFK